MGLFTASNEAHLLAHLTAVLAADGIKLAIGLGADEDARRDKPPRITLVPRNGGRKYTDPSQQFNTAIKVGTEKNISFDAHFWGRDYLDACRLEDAFLKVLYNSLSRNAYELSDGGPAEQPEGPNEQNGYKLITPVRFLKVPVAVENYTPVALDTMTVSGAVSGAAAATITITES